MLVLPIMNPKNKKWLLDLAKKAIETKLTSKELMLDSADVPKEFKTKKACFVTLKYSNRLRGCVGNLLPTQPLYQDVIKNARAAAFADYRFKPLTVDELKQIQIEISILEKPQQFQYYEPEELLNFLAVNKPGVIIRKASRQATFLPQVWEELKDPQEFLEHLCLKAGLFFNEWQKMTSIEFYLVEKIE